MQMYTKETFHGRNYWKKNFQIISIESCKHQQIRKLYRIFKIRKWALLENDAQSFVKLLWFSLFVEHFLEEFLPRF